MSATAAYMIVMQDPSSEVTTYGIPNTPEIPTKIYISYADAKNALMEIIETFDEFTPVAYGDAYPYERTTFEKEVRENNYGLIGWISMKDDDGDVTRVPLGLLKIPIQHTQQASS